MKVVVAVAPSALVQESVPAVDEQALAQLLAGVPVFIILPPVHLEQSAAVAPVQTPQPAAHA